MHQEAIEHLDKSISEVFSLMLNRECSPLVDCSNIQTAKDAQVYGDPAPQPGITATISFSGSMQGTCSVHLPLRTAAAITEDLAGPLSEDAATSLSVDTAGEICNMIAGSWKSRQPDPYATCAISTPLVAAANLHVSEAGAPSSNTPFRHTLVRVYRFEDHCLHLELGFD